ncbi:acetyltransferase (GNAT) family protein [Rhodobacter viridis]|uniref:Acetyltransferase (GNAT) family protein n=1 Tax=Rhodobacter viridis TaxID=1054202 RepID=A0A318U1V8_9RHOB|nr:GNAT family N-acetyltransferase [Rhodobacter viridis]PYF12064.1 acetyltransferase (GNAT) family protein [Rhodobacter viridis]
MTDPLFEVIDATWPAASVREVGGFLIREGQGGGSRVSAASLVGRLEDADIDEALAAQRSLGQTGKFILRPGDEALDLALAKRGFEVFDPVVILAADLAALPSEVPPVTAFAHWPPLAIAREIWSENGIGPARQAVIDRTPQPKATVLGRTKDRAAGAAFVAIHQRSAMLHALVVAPEFRRLGLARSIMAEACRWAATEGAERMTLVVTKANVAALALYRALGMQPVCAYHYRREAQS